jgi:hypothetical protein
MDKFSHEIFTCFKNFDACSQFRRSRFTKQIYVLFPFNCQLTLNVKSMRLYFMHNFKEFNAVIIVSWIYYDLYSVLSLLELIHCNSILGPIFVGRWKMYGSGRKVFRILGYWKLYNWWRWHWGIFVQSKNCGARETAVASERLWNDISRQRHGKHVPEPTDKHAAIEVLFQTVSPTRSVQKVYKDNWVVQKANPRVEAGSNNSTVTLRVVGGDEKGSLKSERVKYGRKSQGTRTLEWLRWRGPASIATTDQSSRQRGAPHQQTRKFLTAIIIWS